VVGQHAKPHCALAMLETHAEPLGQAAAVPHLQVGVPLDRSHHSLAAQQVVPQRGPPEQPPLGAQFISVDPSGTGTHAGVVSTPVMQYRPAPHCAP